MKRGAAKKSVTTTEDVVQRRLNALTPKRQFIDAAMNMGWQLAGAVLIPVFIGVKLDDHFHTTPSYTLTALVLACGGAAAVVWSTIKRVGAEQAEAEHPSTSLRVKESKNNGGK